MLLATLILIQWIKDFLVPHFRPSAQRDHQFFMLPPILHARLNSITTPSNEQFPLSRVMEEANAELTWSFGIVSFRFGL
jgi:hypothetical protein